MYKIIVIIMIVILICYILYNKQSIEYYTTLRNYGIVSESHDNRDQYYNVKLDTVKTIPYVVPPECAFNDTAGDNICENACRQGNTKVINEAGCVCQIFAKEEPLVTKNRIELQPIYPFSMFQEKFVDYN